MWVNQQPCLLKKKLVHQKEQIQEFISAQDWQEFEENPNTKKKTQNDTNLFVQFCKDQGEHRQIEDLEVRELDLLIGNFIATVKKQNGAEYEPTTIRGFFVKH
jgi:hypothetical protein